MLNVSKRNTPENFKGGKVDMFIDQWKYITSDKYILSIIETGYKLEFESEPCLHCHKKEIMFSGKEERIIDELLEKLKGKKVINWVTPNRDQCFI